MWELTRLFHFHFMDYIDYYVTTVDSEIIDNEIRYIALLQCDISISLSIISAMHDWSVRYYNDLVPGDWKRVEQMEHLYLDRPAGVKVLFQGLILFFIVNETLKQNLQSCESLNDLKCVDGTINPIQFN